jgi:hypothetical protein
MTVPALAVFDATRSQVFTGRHYEFTFSNDTVTAPDSDLWPIEKVTAKRVSRVPSPAAKSPLTGAFRGAVVVAAR